MGEAKIRILIIEDDKMVRTAYEEVLKRRGYEIITAEKGKEGLEKILTESPDLVLLDLMLPEMSGDEILEDLHRRGFTDKIPVIVLSDVSEGTTMSKCFKFGARDYILKVNFTVDAIDKKIKEILGK